MSNRIISLRPDTAPVVKQFLGFKLETPFEATRQEHIKLFEENLEGFERAEKMQSELRRQVCIDSGRIPEGAPIQYQSQRKESSFPWVPCALFILSMVFFYLFAASYFNR